MQESFDIRCSNFLEDELSRLFIFDLYLIYPIFFLFNQFAPGKAMKTLRRTGLLELKENEKIER